MKRSDAKNYLPLIEAFAEGKEIEVKDIHGKWVPAGEAVAFSLNPEHYRIKPEPRVFYCFEWNDGSFSCYPSEQKRDRRFLELGGKKKITLIEQLDS